MSEDNYLDPVPVRKVHSILVISLAAFLGGPLGAGYLISENFSNMGAPGKARVAMLTTFLFCIGAVAALLHISWNMTMGTLIASSFYAMVSSFAAQLSQGKMLKQHIKNGGGIYPTWRAVIVSLIGMMVLIVLSSIVLNIMGIQPDTQ